MAVSQWGGWWSQKPPAFVLAFAWKNVCLSSHCHAMAQEKFFLPNIRILTLLHFRLNHPPQRLPRQTAKNGYSFQPLCANFRDEDQLMRDINEDSGIGKFSLKLEDR